MKYHLSNRQLKELHNGKLLRIALPVQESDGFLDDTEARQWAIELIDVEPRFVQRAMTEIVPVNPLVRSTGLASIFGEIARDELPLTIGVECVVVELAAKRVRGTYPIQWPGSVTLDDGRTLP